ncbi:hypothetical protein [Paraburkholderia youngii]|uniref:hypothetical protein n=1 Tax=Paraburkholderia youngii TaxID=2782701 RepID=UPI0015901AEE|nr:hypothetical protein [Paraburkholderia youngii]NUX57617.1 hypothetical protein [Paraburkholderia youngii]
MKTLNTGVEQHRSSRRMMLLLGVASVAATLIALAWGWHLPVSSGGHSSEADDFYAGICTAVPPEAVVGASVPANLVLAIRAPASTPAVPVLDVAAYSPIKVRRGDVVELRIESPREGAVGVHGLSEIARIMPGQSIRLRFKAIYEGRFPVHFHGRDLSHFEIAVIEIRD